MKYRPRSVLEMLLALLIASLFGCRNDTATSPTTIVPITDDLFPLVADHYYLYTGFLVDTNSVNTLAPGILPGTYQTKWTLHPGPSGTWLIQDSTMFSTTFGATVSTRILQIKKDSATGDVAFRQTLGPFYRKFGVSYTDTSIWVWVARPSMGIENIWSGFDTTITAVVPGIGSTQVRLQIFGKFSVQEPIADSSDAHSIYSAYKVRTWRQITVGGIVVQADATTAFLWLAKDVGPVQVNIAGDTENYGHFRVLKRKNF